MKKMIKKILKKSKIIRKLHCAIIDNYNKNKERNVNIDEIIPLHSMEGVDNNRPRINLLIPTLKKEFVFGGISTALKVFDNIAGDKFDKRIILTDSDVHEEDICNLKNAKIVKMGNLSREAFQVVAGNERRKYQLPITENDYFIATSWWSAYILIPFIRAQNEKYDRNNKMIYLIQDYEPGFQSWSSRYILADSTYKNEIDTIAIFNTKILRDFFQNEGYRFSEEYYFDPCLNKELRNILLSKNSVKRKKQIIVYGRANVDRNCFELIVGALRCVLEKYEDANQWEYVSLGENHPIIDLGKGKTLNSFGKVSLKAYANIMLESSVGLSLMVSPHPSYPPLEMSTFGVKTITNKYKNKDISNFNENLVSIDNCSFDHIANELINVMKEYKEMKNIAINDSYVNGNETLAMLCQSIRDKIEKQNK